MKLAFHSIAFSFPAAFVAALMCSFTLVDRVGAHGEIGEDIQNMREHLPEYEESVRVFLKSVDGLVDQYEDEGADAVDTEQFAGFWEDALIHYAVELNYVPLYAKIWQGIYGIKEGIEAGKPIEEIRATQTGLNQTLWQGLGVVKLAAKVQAEKKAAGETTESEDPESERLGPVETVAVIQDKVDRIMAKCAERDFAAAKEMVHDTYLNLFEGIEGELIEHDADLVVALEKDFNVTLPRQIEAEASLDEIKESTAAMKEKLGRAGELLAEAEKDKKEVF